MRHSRFLLMTLCALMLVVSIPGVYAVWTYFETPKAVNQEITPSMGAWKYAKYTITFIDQNEYIDVYYINDDGEKETWEGGTKAIYDDVAISLSAERLTLVNDTGKELLGWENAGGTTMGELPADHSTDIVLYPVWADEYWIRFMDGLGNADENVLLAYVFTQGSKPADLNETEIATALQKAQDRYDAQYGEGAYVISDWSVDYNDESIYNTTSDIVVSAVGAPAEYAGSLEFTPIYDEPNDGIPDAYATSALSDQGETVIEIPEYYNGEPVTAIGNNTFAGFNDLHAAVIPSNVISIGANAFVEPKEWYESDETITIYYRGTYDDWKKITKTEGWDDGVGDGSRVFFLDESGHVDADAGYLEYNGSTWVLHEHAYTYEAAKNCSHGEDSHYEYGGGIFGYGASLQEDEFTDYAGTCDCDSCNGATRPDAEYWTADTTG